MFFPPEIDVLVLFRRANLHTRTTLHKTSFSPMGICISIQTISSKGPFLPIGGASGSNCGCLSLKFLVQFFLLFSFLKQSPTLKGIITFFFPFKQNRRQNKIKLNERLFKLSGLWKPKGKR